MKAIRSAYFHTLGTRTPRQLRVAVVDNGFFGARRDNATNKLAYSTKFPAPFFAGAAPDQIGPVVQSVDHLQLQPVLDPAIVTPTLLSGHGTHVTGLVLGGVAFENDRDVLEISPSKPWLTLSIVNVGDGAEDLPEFEAGTIGFAVKSTNASIANLSIAYTRNQKPTLVNLVQQQRDKLFIVAAGNDQGQSVEALGVYPAALGGDGEDNVVSVAANLQSGPIAAYSNRGAHVVDLGAPGCELESWIDDSSIPWKMSGTSQAAPLVTLTAAMIAALADRTLKPAELKTRLMVSGDALPVDALVQPADWPVYSRSTLNMAKALFIRDDFISFDDDDDDNPATPAKRVVALGVITAPIGQGCDSDRKLNQLSAFKRQGAGAIGFGRGPTKPVDQLCETRIGPKDKLTFERTALIEPDGTVTPSPAAARKINLTNIVEFVRAMDALGTNQ